MTREAFDVTTGLLGGIDIRRTSEEITSEEIADPAILPDIGGDLVLIRPVKTNIDKVGSVFIPDSTKGDVKFLHNVGRVVALGPRVFKDKDGKEVTWFSTGLKVGDIVQWERYVGKRHRYKGVNFVLVRDIALQMKVQSQYDIDPMTSIEE